MKETLKRITEETISIVDHLLNELCDKSYNDYILLIAKASVIPQLENIGRLPYVLDFQMDRYWDSTREECYIKYLNKNYTKPGYDYKDEDGLFNLNVELMIYSHVWESTYYIKYLKQITNILSGKSYDWYLKNPEGSMSSYIINEIIMQLKEVEHPLGDFLDKTYNKYLRNGFAHSLYSIDLFNRTISFHDLKDNDGKKIDYNIGIDEFQEKFLRTVLLCHKLMNSIELQRIKIAEKANGFPITEPFFLPNMKMIQVFVENKATIKKATIPLFKPIIYNPKTKRFNIGSSVKLNTFNSVRKVIATYEVKDEQFVKVEGATKYCSSTLLDSGENVIIEDQDKTDLKFLE